MKRRVRTGEPNKTKWSPHIDRMVSMAKSGISYTEIGKAFGAPSGIIRNILIRRGKYVSRKDLGKPIWQPIETAPKDGTIVIGYDPKAKKWNVKFMAYHGTRTGGFWRNEVVTGAFDPTHWMPLPEPPKV